MEIRRMGPIGAVSGVDVKTVDEANFDRIYRTWLDCNVICVRDQVLEIDDFLAYSRRFGSVVPHPAKRTRHPDFPEITVLGINKFRPDGTPYFTIPIALRNSICSLRCLTSSRAKSALPR